MNINMNTNMNTIAITDILQLQNDKIVVEPLPIVNIVAKQISEGNRDKLIQYKIKCLINSTYQKKYRLSKILLRMNERDKGYEETNKEYNQYNNLWLKYKAGEYELIIS
tara:strand:+ start:234 stop:560 length:327 start_codon:yes stop_codon:yes gene_type:complete